MEQRLDQVERLVEEVQNRASGSTEETVVAGLGPVETTPIEEIAIDLTSNRLANSVDWSTVELGDFEFETPETDELIKDNHRRIFEPDRQEESEQRLKTAEATTVSSRGNWMPWIWSMARAFAGLTKKST